MKTVQRIVEVHVAWLVMVPAPRCITWCSQYELILFVALSSLRVLRAATQWKCGCSFARTGVKPRLSHSISLSSLSSWTPSHVSSHKVLAATRCSTATPPPKAAAPSPYQRASARQMIHPLHVLQTNTLPPSSCFSSFWFICLPPHIAAYPTGCLQF